MKFEARRVLRAPARRMRQNDERQRLEMRGWSERPATQRLMKAPGERLALGCGWENGRRESGRALKASCGGGSRAETARGMAPLAMRTGPVRARERCREKGGKSRGDVAWRVALKAAVLVSHHPGTPRRMPRGRDPRYYSRPWHRLRYVLDPSADAPWHQSRRHQRDHRRVGGPTIARPRRFWRPFTGAR